jgi:hypothetical protein
MDPVAQITNAPGAFGTVIKKYWIFFIVAILALLALSVRYRNETAAKFSSMPASVKTWLKIAGFLVPFGALFLAGDAWAGVGAAHAHAAIGAGWIAAAISAISVAVGSLAFGHVFGAEDSLDLEDSYGGRTITFTPAAGLTQRSLFINVHRATDYRGRPLVATAITIAVTVTVNNPAPGSATIHDQNLALLLDSVSIESPLLGTLLDRTTGTGPVLDLLISFLGLGFNNAGNVPVDPIVQGTSVGGTNVKKITKYFTFPIATKYLSDPLLTAMYLKALDKTEIKLNVAGTGCLDGVSTGATISGADCSLSGTVTYLPHSHFFRPMVAYYKIDAPSSNSDGLTFNSFGDAGPRCTKPVDNVMDLAQVSNLLGLPGNTTISNITRILGSQIGLDDVQNLDQFVLARLRAQLIGASGLPKYSENGNYMQVITSPLGGVDRVGLLALHLVQPSVGTSWKNGIPANGQSKITIREELTAPLTTQHAFLVASIRELDDGYVSKISSLYGGKVPMGTAVHSARRR